MRSIFAASVHSAITLPLLLATTVLVPVHAQQPQPGCTGAALTGAVQDSTAAVIPGAVIQIDGNPALSQTSGNDGRFSFPCVAAGSHHLTASAAGFATVEQDLPGRVPGDLHITLIPASSVSVTVDAEESSAESLLGGLSGTSLSGTQLETLADDPDDLQRELQQLAAAGGGSPSGTVISVDGFQSDSPLPPKSSIARIEVNPDLFSRRTANRPGMVATSRSIPNREPRTSTGRYLRPTLRTG